MGPARPAAPLAVQHLLQGGGHALHAAQVILDRVQHIRWQRQQVVHLALAELDLPHIGNGG